MIIFTNNMGNEYEVTQKQKEDMLKSNNDVGENMFKELSEEKPKKQKAEKIEEKVEDIIV